MDDTTDNHIETRYMELIGAIVRVACLDYLAIEKPEYRLTECILNVPYPFCMPKAIK